MNWNSRRVHAYHSKKVLHMWNMTLRWLLSTYPGYNWLCPLQDWWWTSNEMLYFKCAQDWIIGILQATINGKIREEKQLLLHMFIGSQIPGPHPRGEGLVTSAESLGSINVDCFLQKFSNCQSHCGNYCSNLEPTPTSDNSVLHLPDLRHSWHSFIINYLCEWDQ